MESNPGIGNHLRGNTTITAKMLEAVAEQFAKGAETVQEAVAGIDLAAPKRKYHPWLHPTKGWRMFARPRKTNRRRKLIPQGRLIVFR